MDQEWHETHPAPHLDGIYLSVVSARRALSCICEGQRTVVASPRPRATARRGASGDLSYLCMLCPIPFRESA